MKAAVRLFVAAALGLGLAACELCWQQPDLCPTCRVVVQDGVTCTCGCGDGPSTGACTPDVCG